jgi:hypothetical protein
MSGGGSGSFSNALRLTDLNDFVGPSQACIKPLIDEQQQQHQAALLQQARSSDQLQCQEKGLFDTENSV